MKSENKGIYIKNSYESDMLLLSMGHTACREADLTFLQVRWQQWIPTVSFLLGSLCLSLSVCLSLSLSLSWRDSPLVGLGLLLIHEDFCGF